MNRDEKLFRMVMLGVMVLSAQSMVFVSNTTTNEAVKSAPANSIVSQN